MPQKKGLVGTVAAQRTYLIHAGKVTGPPSCAEDCFLLLCVANKKRGSQCAFYQYCVVGLCSFQLVLWPFNSLILTDMCYDPLWILTSTTGLYSVSSELVLSGGAHCTLASLPYVLYKVK